MSTYFPISELINSHPRLISQFVLRSEYQGMMRMNTVIALYTHYGSMFSLPMDLLYRYGSNTQYPKILIRILFSFRSIPAQ